MTSHFTTELATSPAAYASRLSSLLAAQDWTPVTRLIEALRASHRAGGTAYVCGNGGSAANAIHWANDFAYPVSKGHGGALRMAALTANTAVLTCLANDIGYDHVFAHQLRTLGQRGDVLVVLSGSGNSGNVVEALGTAREIGMTTAAVTGFDGGRCRLLADIPIHFAIDDMQIAEDAQLIVNHMIMRALQEEL